MTTIVGMQSNFEEALKDLIELEFDAKEAYETAIQKLENQEYKTILTSFMKDHIQHINEITDLLKKNNIVAPKGPDFSKKLLAKGKVILGSLIGDNSILMAMRSNEIDTNTAYERLTIHDNIWPSARDILDRALKDEHRHKKWFESIFNKD